MILLDEVLLHGQFKAFKEIELTDKARFNLCFLGIPIPPGQSIQMSKSLNRVVSDRLPKTFIPSYFLGEWYICKYDF